MLRKMLIQTVACLMIAAVIAAAGQSELTVMRKGAEAVMSYMAVSYSWEDVKNAAGKTSEVFAVMTGKVDEAVDVMTGKPVYGEPIDEKYEGNETVVYAVGGGKVTAVGENEEIGKYIRITHGSHAESLYGNLKSVRVSTPVNVKKGQIIGVYEKKKGKDFYYSFKEF